MDERDRAFQAERIHMNNLLDEEKAINKDLSERLDAAMETNDRLLTQLDDKDTEVYKLKKRIDGQAHTIGELEDKLNNAEQNYRTVCEHLDDEVSEGIRFMHERDTWKQVAKWLIKQMGGKKQ